MLLTDRRSLSKLSHVKIEFRVSPNAKASAATGIDERGVVRLRLAAPPVDGKANAELVRWLADTLHVKPRQVTLLHGHASKMKIVEVSGLERDDALRVILPPKLDQTGSTAASQ